MTREEEIINQSHKYRLSNPSKNKDFTYNGTDLEEAYESGAKWADNNPSQQALSKELHRLGYGITLNGDIISKVEENKQMERYVEYEKNKLIEKACEWLKNNTISVTTDTYTYTASSYDISKEDFIEEFRKEMEK